MIERQTNLSTVTGAATHARQPQDKRSARHVSVPPARSAITKLPHRGQCARPRPAEPVEVAALEHDVFNHGIVIRYATGELATIGMFTNGSFGYPKELYEMIGQGGVVAVDHMVEVRSAGIAGGPVRQVFPLAVDQYTEVGTEGGLSGWLTKRRAACERAAAMDDPALQLAVEPDKGHAHALRRFIAEIRGEGPVVCGIDDAVLATEVAFAAIAAARSRRSVTLEEVRERRDVVTA